MLHRSRAAAILLLAVWAAAAGAVNRVTGIRTGVTEGRVRIVVDLDAEPRYNVWTPGDPERIAIDFFGAVFHHDVGRIELGDPLVRRIRINALSGPKAQVVLDLNRKARFEIFTLPPQGERGHRLVCDVYRRGPVEESDRPPVWRVMIDPGHGGRDVGAISPAGDREADICLDVAKRLQRALDDHADMEAHLTRSDNETLGLRERIRRAEAVSADIFVSIHVNAAHTRQARGVEVFYLSLKGATDEASRELARLENEAEIGDQEVSLEEGMPDIPFSFDLRQSDTMLRSSLLAESILGGFESEGLAASRGVKQAGFLVLKSFHIPSALVELGFLSNPQDLKRLRSSGYRARLARTLEKGILAFHERYAPRPGH
ncbi:MAG: AMIN domain-containing protein [Candidatus Eisenbacteria bacterium]|nr:AMIN domain-containing protein [Candidatus Eisenbacteria bacterium]